MATTTGFEVVVSGKLEPRGFVMDFAEMDAAIMPMIKEVDHRLFERDSRP